jgi:glycosyltransferase involved in cell wall biosynthesis
MTLTEAAGCGTPSVATDIAGHRDSVSPDLSGLLARSSREFTEQIAAVLTNTALRDRLSVGALQHASTLTWTATALGTFTPLAEDAIRRQKGRR